MYAKLNKCVFLLEQVIFLGHKISKDGLSVDPAKIEAVVNWECPNNAKSTRFSRPCKILSHIYSRFFIDCDTFDRANAEEHAVHLV